MPSACRRILVLLVVALLGVGGPVTSSYAQGAGDQQYQDPFSEDSGGGSGNSNSGSGNSNSGSGSGDIDPITPAPQTSGGTTGSGTSGSGTSGSATSGSATSGTTAGTTSTPSVAASGTLPNTGLDARVLVLAGAAVLLLGVGLRMRNAPERF